MIAWLTFSILTAICYWIGGRSWGNKAVRRFGCPIFIYGYSALLLKNNLIQRDMLILGIGLHLIAYIITAFALSTYHDYLAPDGTSENWLCWLMTGICYGLAAFPLTWIGIHIYMFLIRAVILGLVTMIWSEVNGNVHSEEFGRGFFIAASIPILVC